jgi:hypothetical protein
MRVFVVKIYDLKYPQQQDKQMASLKLFSISILPDAPKY